MVGLRRIASSRSDTLILHVKDVLNLELFFLGVAPVATTHFLVQLFSKCLSKSI